MARISRLGRHYFHRFNNLLAMEPTTQAAARVEPAATRALVA
ncbi:MAG TPA: hypothetical protein VF018_04095 [Acidobacteriaceae bacterium]